MARSGQPACEGASPWPASEVASALQADPEHGHRQALTLDLGPSAVVGYLSRLQAAAQALHSLGTLMAGRRAVHPSRRSAECRDRKTTCGT
jgi:hypothetical protein